MFEPLHIIDLVLFYYTILIRAKFFLCFRISYVFHPTFFQYFTRSNIINMVFRFLLYH